LGESDLLGLSQLIQGRTRTLPPRIDIVREREIPRTMRLMLSGWAYRYKQLPDGRRQIVGFFLPGDICDLHLSILESMDHSLATITQIEMAEVENDVFETTIAASRTLKSAFWWENLIAVAVLREWVLNLGQRTALERIAHLLCELYTRMEKIGLASNHQLEFPLTQMDLGETCGISTVHVNRILKELRRENLISFEGRLLTFPDMARLKSLATFDPRYLHLGSQSK
jgi:CRP-like cAMP-binding protein